MNPRKGRCLDFILGLWLWISRVFISYLQYVGKSSWIYLLNISYPCPFLSILHHCPSSRLWYLLPQPVAFQLATLLSFLLYYNPFYTQKFINSDPSLKAVSSLLLHLEKNSKLLFRTLLALCDLALPLSPPSSHARLSSPSLRSPSSPWSLCLCSFRNTAVSLWFFAWLVLYYLSSLSWNATFSASFCDHVYQKAFLLSLCNSPSWWSENSTYHDLEL